MNILGLQLGHDSASALIVDDRLVGMIERERLTRVKYDRAFMPEMIDEVLKLGGISFFDIDYVVASLCSGQQIEPRLKKSDLWGLTITRDGEPYNHGPRQLNPWEIEDRIEVKFDGITKPAYQVQHHIAHVASSYYLSNFDKAIGLSYDGSGAPENQMSLMCQCKGNRVDLLGVPMVGIGAAYGLVATWMFDSWHDSGKVMGLSAYGEPEYFYDVMVKEPGIMHIIYNFKKYLPDLEPLREAGWESKVGRNTAASIQKWLEESVQCVARGIKEQQEEQPLVISGGCSLNVIINRYLHDNFPDIYCAPFPKDSGVAPGGALYVLHHIHNRPRQNYTTQEVAFLGRGEGTADCDVKAVAKELHKGQTVLWHQGRAEVGPRALTHRSIFADPRVLYHKEFVSEKIKGRESYRPLAPIVLAEDCSKYFDIEPCTLSEFMLVNAKVTSKEIPAVTHVDGTARVQTVSKEFNPVVHELLTEFKALTGCPVLINTSLNIQGQAICDTERDTLWTFDNCDAGVCVVDGEVYKK